MPDQATVLLPVLARSPGHLVWRAHARVLQLLADRLPPGIDLHTYGVLLALADGAPRSQQSLAETVKVSPTTMARVAADLAGQGLVERLRNPADRRSYTLTRTPAGADAVASWAPYVLDAEDSLARGFTPGERDELRGLLLALVAPELAPEPAPELAPATGPPDELLGSLAFLVTRAHFGMHRDVLAGLAPLGLEPRHVGALTALDATGPVSQAELARHLGVSGPSVVQMADDLEARGLVRRRRPARDRREQVLHPAPHAPDVLDQATRLVAAALAVRLAPLSPDRVDRLVGLLVRFVTG